MTLAANLRRWIVVGLAVAVACALAAGPVTSAPTGDGVAEVAKKQKLKKKCAKGKQNKKKCAKRKKGKKGKKQRPNGGGVQAPPGAAPGRGQGGSKGDGTASSALERAVFVGNNWEGTADVIRFKPPDAPGKEGKFEQITRLNIIPDRDERMAEIMADPDKLAFYLAIQQGVGEGNDQYVDDMYSTNDGRLLVVSRPSFADVIGMELATREIVWRFPMEGYRSDHVGVSPDGTRVAVSDSTANKVHILEMATGAKVGEFSSGDSPHENTYSQDGTKIFHASIGRVYTPTDQHLLSPTKGAEYFQIVDANTGEILRRIADMGQKIEDDTCGPDAVADKCQTDMSSAIRPMAISPDERFIYFQVSFFHGFIEYDVDSNRVLRVAELPDIYEQPRETYLLDSAHHGIAINAGGTHLCVAGTMSDYATIVSRADFTDRTILQQPKGAKPYWSTTTDDGEHCLVSWSGTDSISAISYGERREVARIDVGDHPQRVRTGVVRRGWARSQGA